MTELAIRTQALTKRYGATLALDTLDLGVRTGEVYRYLGPTGAATTTTIRPLLGLHRPTSGRAEVFGIDVWSDPIEAHRRRAYVPGEPFLWPALTGAETLAYVATLHGGTGAAYQAEGRLETLLSLPAGRRAWLAAASRSPQSPRRSW